jgi:hypothetical protein
MPDPLPLIVLLARNLLEALDIPAVLASQEGEWLFYNEAAGSIIGRRFEEYGRQTLAHWTAEGPLDGEGRPIAGGELPIVVALRDGVPSTGRLRIEDDRGDMIEIDVTALPLRDEEGSRGAIVLFWPPTENGSP